MFLVLAKVVHKVALRVNEVHDDGVVHLKSHDSHMNTYMNKL